ncbi:hypothetical protein DFS34DRAFT_28495 [Phlyctochytrium arcticum]|nr:hypothetical protein DFS34DRAFT_28495 [Phlyctochytrium arcticum]
MDRVTQIQELLDKTVQDFAMAMGQLQMDAAPRALDPSIPVTFMPVEEIRNRESKSKHIISKAATDLVVSIKSINYLVDHLPGIDMSDDQQKQRIRELEEEGQAATEDLRLAVEEADGILQEIRDTRTFLAKQRTRPAIPKDPT